MSAGIECLNPSFSRLRLSTKASMNLTGFSFSTYWSMVSGKEHCLVSVGSVYMFAHGFSVVLKLALSLTVSSEHRKRLFTQSGSGLQLGDRTITAP